MDRERGKREREHERSRQEKEARVGCVGDKTDSNWWCCLRSLS